MCHCEVGESEGAGLRFHALGPIYYRDSQGAVLVFDVSDPDSFQKVCLSIWLCLVRREAGAEGKGLGEGAAADPGRQRRPRHRRQQGRPQAAQRRRGGGQEVPTNHSSIPHPAASRYAESVGASYHPTSAKENAGIEPLFLDLTKSPFPLPSIEGVGKG